MDESRFDNRVNLTFPIIRTEVEPVIHADNDFATVAFLRINHAILEPKAQQDFDNMQVPPLLSDDLFRVRDAVERSQESNQLQLGEAESTDVLTNVIAPASSSKRIDSWVAISNVHRDLSSGTQAEISIEEEVEECFCSLKGLHV